MEKAYRVVTHYNNEYGIRSPFMALTVADARAHAQEEQPHARIVTDAEELADVLVAVSDERKALVVKVGNLEADLALAGRVIEELQAENTRLRESR